MNKLSLIAAVFLLVITACRKDIDDEMTTEIPNEPPIIENYDPVVKPIQASVIGFVVDETSTPVSLANVTMGSNTTMTDEYGHFFFNDVDMNQRGTLVKIEKEGYFEGSRRFFPLDGSKSRVKVELLEKNFSQSFESNTGGIITIANETTVEFDANTIQKEDGQTYTGEVQIAAKWMDPTATSTFDQMPGNLQGVNQLNEEVALQTYGMVAVELQSPTGEALNIKTGETATLKMEVPQALLNNAPQEIPLWSYNEEYGLWQIDGTATLQNGSYVGEVSHFSFWNCDYPGELVEIDFTLLDEASSNPLPNTAVLISVISGASSGAGYTNEDGSLNGLVPANEALLLEVIGLCGEVIYSDEIGPFDADASLGNIAATLNENTLTITGTVGCDGVQLTGDAVVLISFDGYTVHHYTTDGTIDFSTTICSYPEEVIVTAVDLSNLNQSEVSTTAFSEPLNIGAINTCNGGTLSDLISMTIDGETRIYPLPVHLNSFSGYFVEYNSGQSYVGFGVYGDGVGSFGGPNGNQIEAISDGDWTFAGYFETLEVETYGEVGEKITGSFENINDFDGTTTEMTGFFIITRLQ